MASLSLKHICKVYDGTTRAVNDFNMEIRDREFIVFVGPSGCGKSTTLRMIAGLEDISAGELSIDGVVVNDMEPRDRNIAMVFQNYALYPHMTVYENMAFSLRTAHMPSTEIHEKVTEAARILGITEYLERKPRALSGGQRQRVALGRAIVRNPKVFLFDEPLSNLDAKLRATMRAEIIRLYERLKTTFIYVTHDQVEAMTMGSRIVVMRGGNVMQIDTPKNLYNHPANLFVAGFIGTPRMNFWDATMTREGETVRIRPAVGGHKLEVPYEYLYRVQTRYMDGAHPVVVGVRPDHVRPWEEGLDPTRWARLSVTVSVVEALGGEALVYGHLKGSDPAGEPDVIFKATEDAEIIRGDHMEVAVDLGKLHLFDRATEESLLPRVPRENVCTCEVTGASLSFAGQRFSLPSALQEAGRDAPTRGELFLPTDAILLGTGVGRATVEEVEAHRETGADTHRSGRLYRLSVGGEVLFARTDESPDVAARYKVGDTLPFDIAFERISIPAADITPLPAENILRGRLTREKIMDERAGSPTKGKRVYRFFLDVADRPLAASDSLSEKLFSAKGSGIFRLALDYRFPPEAATVTCRARRGGEAAAEDRRAPSGRALPGKVTAVLDYGRMTYGRISIGSETLIAPYAGAAGDAVHITLDQSRLTVADGETGIILV